MSKYQITLTPVDKFFFGGDMTFQVGDNEKDEFNSQYKSYIIQSSMFPQQTSLLGMLRFLILRNAGEKVFSGGKIVGKSEAESLIGGKSFSVNDDHSENSFGLIKHLSGVRVLRTAGGVSQCLEYAPLFGDVSFEALPSGTYNLNKVNIPCIEEEYDAKKGLYITLTDGLHKYKLDEIFAEDRRIGIDRDIRTGRTDDGALFKQISYRFKNGDVSYCFAFDAEVVDSLKLDKYDGQLVSVGADNSQFVINIKPAADESKAAGSPGTICLQSPTFLTRKEAQQASFAITRLMPFRFLTDREDNSDNDNRSFHVLNSKLKRSERYELYAPGSVFYFRDDKQKQGFEEFIKNKKEFRQIGYNEYK